MPHIGRLSGRDHADWIGVARRGRPDGMRPLVAMGGAVVLGIAVSVVHSSTAAISLTCPASDPSGAL